MNMFSDTITLYNSIVIENQINNSSVFTKKWVRNVLSGCNIRKINGENKYGTDTYDIYTYNIVIKPNSKYIEQGIGGYDSKTYNEIVNNNLFTFKNEDIVVLGKCEDTIEDNSSGSSLLEKYENKSFKIKGYEDNTFKDRSNYTMASCYIVKG